jgi:hypothetical protein
MIVTGHIPIRNGVIPILACSSSLDHVFLLWREESTLYTYRFLPSSRQHDAMSEEKRRKPIRHNSSWNLRIPIQGLTIIPSLLEEAKATEKRKSQQPDRPPELNREKRMRRDEARECGTSNRAEQERHVQGSEGTATLMQEEQIGDNARP